MSKFIIEKKIINLYLCLFYPENFLYKIKKIFTLINNIMDDYTNFEIKDSTNITREIGNIHMVIDDIVDNNIKAGFGINVVDKSETNGATEREILYINNQSVMDIEKINLGTDVNKINTVSLSAINHTLMINNTSLQTIINNEIQKMFSVDTDGKLNIMYKENTYICEKK